MNNLHKAASTPGGTDHHFFFVTGRAGVPHHLRGSHRERTTSRGRGLETEYMLSDLPGARERSTQEDKPETRNT